LNNHPKAKIMGFDAPDSGSGVVDRGFSFISTSEEAEFVAPFPAPP
jgi:hypothetical protein